MARSDSDVGAEPAAVGSVPVEPPTPGWFWPSLAGLLAVVMLVHSQPAALAAVVLIVCAAGLAVVFWLYTGIVGDYRPYGRLTGYLVRLGVLVMVALWLGGLALDHLLGSAGSGGSRRRWRSASCCSTAVWRRTNGPNGIRPGPPNAGKATDIGRVAARTT